MKVMCMYLPQYHTFPENDEWWGKGYTEWVAVKRAKPLFKGHVQPKVPLDDRYYDLSDESAETFKWQAQIARKYGVYGFSIYQYYFNGKKLMNRPMEILRDHPEIDIHYNICWANETWTRTWYGLSNQILMAQEYGNEADWNDYFDYLLTFFRDERYIKVDNKPVLQIYKTFDIDCLSDMLKTFNQRAREAGFEGIYVVSGKTAAGVEKRENLVDAYYYFEPGYTLKNDFSDFEKFSYNFMTLLRSLRNKLFGKRAGYILERRISAKSILNSITRRSYKENEFPGLIPDWDNTPRRDYKGLVYMGTSPESFEKALRILKDKIKNHKNDFVYINAWNEWGEGAYIEPDKNRGFAYLEAIKRVTDD